MQRLPIAPGSNNSNDPEEPPPQPSAVQQEALEALALTRLAGYRRGLIVMATGLGKPLLAAFDSEPMQASRVLFVAHREEVLLQAEASFQRIRPQARVGRFTVRRDRRLPGDPLAQRPTATSAAAEPTSIGHAASRAGMAV